MTEVELVENIKKGDKDVFAIVVEKYSDRVFRTSIGFVHIKEDAEDLTQEVFVRIFRSIHNFKGDSELSTWIYKITVNTCINYVNTKNRFSLIDFAGNLFHTAHENYASADKNPEEKYTESERENAIRRAIDNLPEKQRIAFVLSKYDEMPQKEIALIMQTSVGAVEQHIQRAKVTLQKKLQHLVGK